jgi:glutaredoxin-like YruB-family protein
VRALFLVVLIGLIGAGAIYILSGTPSQESDGPDFASKLKEITTRVTSSAADGEDAGMEPSGDEGDSKLGLGRWFGKDEQEESGSIKDVYYQYVDDSGSVHFVQNLGEVPAKWQSRAGRIEVERTLPTPGRGAARPADTRRTAATRPSQKPSAYRSGPEVVVYTTAWCGWCRKTLAFLDERGVRYVNKDIEANDWNRDELIEKTGRTSIPVVEIDGEIIRGFNAERMEQLLARSG